MVTDHEMRMEALRLSEENDRLFGFLLREKAITAILVQSLREIEKMSRDPLTVNEARKVINAVLATIGDGGSMDIPAPVSQSGDSK
jgi:hypothetical protein